jgi:hypothetical protein
MNNELSRIRPFLFFGLAWAFPGLGHVLQKKIAKGTVFCLGVSALVVLGLVMGGQVGVLYDLQPYTILRFVGSLGNAAAFFAVKWSGLGAGRAAASTFDFGTTYLVCAGLMNFLIAFNAYEVAREDDHV